MAEWDASEVHALAASMKLAPARVIAAARPVVERAGANMKASMRRAASGHSHLPGLARTVEYDVKTQPTEISVEVGFRKQGQGNLANIAAFGSVNNAPVMDITSPLADEVPRFLAWASKAVAEELL